MRRAAHRTCSMLAALALSSPLAANNWTGHAALGVTSSIDSQRSLAGSIGVERDWRPVYGGKLAFDTTLFAIKARSNDNGLDRHVQALAVGLRWRRGSWVLGFSPAVATARTDALSSTMQFVTTLGWQWQCCALLFQHISNGGTRGRNGGENLLMLEASLGGGDRARRSLDGAG